LRIVGLLDWRAIGCRLLFGPCAIGMFVLEFERKFVATCFALLLLAGKVMSLPAIAIHLDVRVLAVLQDSYFACHRLNERRVILGFYHVARWLVAA